MNQYVPPPCPRCGSKQVVARTWVEKIETYAGSTDVTFNKVECTNAACQEAFEKNRLEEKQKKAAILLKREQADVQRKQLAEQKREEKRKQL